MQHRNAPLTPNGRLRMVQLVEQQGLTFEAAAAASSVARSTVHTWVGRWREASEQERATLTCLKDRPSRPRSSPTMLCEADHDRVCELRRRTGWGPRLIATEVELAHATVWRALRRRGCSQRPRPERGQVIRYEWPCPGDLLHIDIKDYARFERPGHAVTGDRTRTGADKRARLGYDHAHAAIDDHSRLAFAQLRATDRATDVVEFVKDALAFYAAHGVRVRRILTDNAWCYTHSRALGELLAERGIRHLTTEPYRPETNGKVERFHQTMEREWAKGLPYRSSDARNEALPHWLRHYNERRRHSAIGDRPPISRVRNLPRQDS